jgi:hypothetical protein
MTASHLTLHLSSSGVFTMSQLRAMVLALALVSPLAMAANSPVDAPAGPAAKAGVVRPENYLVFVDPATGFMFVKTPVGWKFRGQLPADRLESLPAGTFTRLIAPVSIGVGS